MYRRRNPFYSPWEDAIEGLFLAFVVSVVLAFFAVMGSAISYSNDNSNRNRLLFQQELLMQSPEQEVAEEKASAYRQQVARQLLHLDQQWIDDRYEELTRGQLEHVAATGDPIALPEIPDPPRLRDYYMWMLWYGLPILYAVFALCLFAAYAFESGRRTWLLDLQWRRPGTWAFFLLTLPVAFPFYLASFLRGMYAKHFGQGLFEDEPRRRGEHPRDPQEDFDDYFIGPAPQVMDPFGLHFPDGPTPSGGSPDESVELTGPEARDQWIELLGERMREAQKAALAEKEQEVQSLQSRLGDTGQSLAQIQRDLGAARAELARLKSFKDLDVLDEETRVRIVREYDRLLQLPSVEKISIRGHVVRVVCRNVTVTVLGEERDLGDYTLEIDPMRSTRVEVLPLRNPKRGLTHPYLEGYHHFRFCYGSRTDQISVLVRKGEYLSALALAVESLHHINAGQEYTVHQQFPKPRKKVENVASANA